MDYWISYSYLDSKRDFLNYPYSLNPNFASKHTLSFVAKGSLQALKHRLMLLILLIVEDPIMTLFLKTDRISSEMRER